MRKGKSGIARVFEAILAVVVMAFALTAYIQFDPFATSQSACCSGGAGSGAGTGAGVSLMHSLDVEEIVSMILASDNWESDLELYLTSNIPAGTYYTLKVLKISGNNETQLNTQPIGNIEESEMAKLSDTTTMRYIVSPLVAESLVTPQLHKVDIILAMDTSGSMGNEGKMAHAKKGARDFIDVIRNMTEGYPPRIQIGLVTYSTNAIAQHGLSYDYDSVETAVKDIHSPNGYTNIDEGVGVSYNMLINSPQRNEAKSIIVFLTDGCATAWTDSTGTHISSGSRCDEIPSLDPRNEAIASSNIAKNNHTEIFSIGLGLNFDPYLLKCMANSPESAHFYHSPTPEELSAIYHYIAYSILVGATTQETVVLELTVGSGG